MVNQLLYKYPLFLFLLSILLIFLLFSHCWKRSYLYIHIFCSVSVILSVTFLIVSFVFVPFARLISEIRYLLKIPLIIYLRFLSKSVIISFSWLCQLNLFSLISIQLEISSFRTFKNFDLTCSAWCSLYMCSAFSCWLHQGYFSSL